MDPTPCLPDAAASARRSDLGIGPIGADREAARRLSGRRLLVARVAWLAVVVPTIGLTIPGFLVAFDRPEMLHQPAVLGLAERLGMPNQVVMAAGLLVPMAAVAAVAIFLFWRRSDDWMAMLFSLQMITSIAFTTRSLSARFWRISGKEESPTNVAAGSLVRPQRDCALRVVPSPAWHTTRTLLIAYVS